MHVVDTLGFKFASTNMGTDVITSSRRRRRRRHGCLSLFSLFFSFQSPLFRVNSDRFNQRFKLYLVKHLMDNKERRGVVSYPINKTRPRQDSISGLSCIMHSE
jgi:hypothetical protein